MNTPAKLIAHDRCSRFAFLGKTWERNRVSPLFALYAAIEDGLTYEGEEDPGQFAGDCFMTTCAERGLNVTISDLYGSGLHHASLADMLTFVLRSGAPWARPETAEVGGLVWEPSCFMDTSRERLRRIVLVDRWASDREYEESLSWRSLGEVCAYGLPMIQTIVIIGQSREGRRHGPWSKAWLHPVNSALRMRKRSGKGFDGQWKPIWREETEFSREKWLDAMTSDGVLQDALFEVEVPVPPEKVRSNIRQLAEKKMAEIEATTVPPDPRLSVCFSPTACEFSECCPRWVMPSIKGGFNKI